MENLPSEFLIQVYTYNKTPISLILVNKHIYKLFTSPLAKAKWALGTFGKTHALFHAIRLGKTFITVDVIKALLKLKANFSRYLVQICFAERSTQQTECNVLCGIYPKISWFSEMSLEAYITLINEGTSRFGTDAHLNTNDAKMFSFLSGQLLPDDQASILIKKNLKVIEDLIVNKEFTPFPPRPKVSNDKKNILARDDNIKKEFDNLETSFIKDEQVKSSNKNNSNDNQHLFVYDFKKETFTDMLKNYINPGKWFRELEKEHNNTSKATTSSDTFINLFNMFWKRINEETSLLNLSEK
ncbi:315_t:CDS:2 [Entrophospora sp. SA101]|nr:315_t:CDS:2 [Entrophospora sp. SA101]